MERRGWGGEAVEREREKNSIISGHNNTKHVIDGIEKIFMCVCDTVDVKARFC
jgi:hypothetical protein